MRKPKNKAHDESRREARLLMRRLHPDVDWHLHLVHHKDENPLNNAIENLEIKGRSKHTQDHNKKPAFEKGRGYLLTCGHYENDSCDCWDTRKICNIHGKVFFL